MACFHPLKAWRTANGGPLAFSVSKALNPDAPFFVPCGQCVGCRLERSRQWAIRCMHEASLYTDNCFLTLTYSDAFVPYGRTLVKADISNFLKRLREHVARKNGGRKLRVYYCGEYGEKFGRPHYHVLVFNYDFGDKVFWRRGAGGDRIYRSAFLESLWTVGNSEIGSVTFNSAAYVARYILKKRTGADASKWYEYVDEDGVVHDRLPEFTDMSRRPGIGRPWLEKFHRDVYDFDFVVVNGKRVRPPRAYDVSMELCSPEEMALIKRKRKRRARKHSANNTPDRLRVREQVVSARLATFLKRDLE